MHGIIDKSGLDFLSGGGEMASLIRAFDWSATALGPFSAWPQSLKTTVSMLLRSPVPIVLLWGPDGRMIYNDAYSEFAGGRHPLLLGSKVVEGWPEVAEFNANVMRVGLAGGTLSFRDQELTLYRTGSPEQVWMNLDYSPVIDESGRPAGVLAVVVETTEAVQAQRRLAFQYELADRLLGLHDARAITLAAAEALGRYLRVGRAGYAEVDETGTIVRVDQDWTNGKTMSLAGEARILEAFGPRAVEDLRAGHTVIVEDCLTDPRSAGAHYAATWESIGARSLIVVPLLRGGRLNAFFYLHEPQPRAWTPWEASIAKDVAMRTRDAVERVRAEEALRDSETRLRLAVDAGRMAVWRWDARSDRILPSPELNRLLGFPPDYAFSREEVRARYYPGELERVQAAGQDALQAGHRFFEVAFRFGWPEPPRWLMLRAEIVMGPDGAPAEAVGVVLDVTEREQAREQVRELAHELRAALAAGSLGTYAVDHVTGNVRTSPGLNAIYGYPEDKALTLEDLRARYHPDDADEIRRGFGGAADPSVTQHDVELRLLMPDGTIRWVYGKGEYIRDAAGRALVSRGIVMDITERKRAEEHQRLLINELNHRVKNTLATVQSIVTQSLRGASSTADAQTAIEARLFGLSRAHDVLTRENWEHAELREIAAHALAPYAGPGSTRVHIEGPAVLLPPRAALAIAMALQELATNAVKYGALSNEAGRVRLTWSREGDGARAFLNLRWEESGGPAVSPPSRRGFGTRLIERSLAHDLDGNVRIDFVPQGLICTIIAPLPR